MSFRCSFLLKRLLCCCSADDVFGPMFHLGQDKWTKKVRKEDLPPGLESDGASIGWHSDGPVGYPEM